ncbi:MAG TPA: glycosyltransferase family 39 protein [Myxococcota bacterium]
MSRRLLGWPLVGALVLAHWAMALTAVEGKSNVFDEPLHQTAGFAYWIFDDYRVHPENGNLPQRIFGLPLASDAERYRFPSTDSELWRRSAEWALARAFFFEEGNDFASMLRVGRALAATLGAGIALLVYGWSRRLFGREGAALSLLLAAFSPNLLAHTPLMTSDTALTLCLGAALASLWTALHRVTPVTVLVGGGVCGLLFVSKFSAFLFIPMALILLALRVADGRALRVRGFGGWHRIETRGRQLAALGAVLVVYAALTTAVIWASYGFRYTAFGPVGPPDSRLMEPWESVLAAPGPVAPLLAAARERRLLPEAYLYGAAFVDKHSRARFAFLNEEFSVTGWWYFFPYAFAVKTPLGLLALLALAACALGPGARRSCGTAVRGGVYPGLYAAAPLWVLLGVFCAFSVTARVNVGLRHLLPIYPALFVLAGAAARWIVWRRRVPAALVWISALGFVAASLGIRPHYLAFFNALVGPEHGYRHLVDSSLDWGQDLPGLATWLDADPAAQRGAPVYLAYFGSASPQAYGVEARALPSYHEWRRAPDAGARELEAGIYCISATLLQAVYTDYPGPWTAAREAQYQRARDARAAGPGALDSRAQGLRRAQRTYDQLRFGRLAAYLRRREPDAHVGYSILIYRLSEQQLHAALRESPAEFAPEPGAAPAAPAP